MDVLLDMEKDSPCFNGHIYFTDPRLVANGFEIRMIPGTVTLKDVCVPLN